MIKIPSFIKLYTALITTPFISTTDARLDQNNKGLNQFSGQLVSGFEV